MSTPTTDQIRAARHSGFKNSTWHRSAGDQAKLQASYHKQDARREKNVATFVGQIRGAAK